MISYFNRGYGNVVEVLMIEHHNRPSQPIGGIVVYEGKNSPSGAADKY